MKNKNLYICSHSFSTSNQLLDYAKNKLTDFNITWNQTNKTMGPSQIIGQCVDSDIILVGHEKIDQSILKQLPKLKAIAKYGVGLDNINVKDCADNKTPVLYCPGVNAAYVAEHTIGLATTLMRNLYHQTKLLKNKEWQRNGGHSIVGKTVAIIGVGHIGTIVAKIFHSMGAKIIGVDLLDKSHFLNSIKASQQDFITAISQADLVSLHVPLTDQSNYMINHETLNKFKKSSYLVNTSRGEVVKESDLIEHLDMPNRKVIKAALDVFENEPDPQEELLRHNDIICTPHIAANCVESKWAMGTSIIHKILDFNTK